MIKIRVSYQDPEEKEQLIQELQSKFKIHKVSNEIQGKGKGLYKKTYIDLSQK